MRYLVIGDVHGENAELHALLEANRGQFDRVVFLGDLVDRGPHSGRVVQTVLSLWRQGLLECFVMGNHDHKIYRHFMGRGVNLTGNAQRSVNEINELGLEEQFRELCQSDATRIAHRVGNHLFVHAAPSYGMYAPNYAGPFYRNFSNKDGSHAHALYGYTTGNRTPEGYPERLMHWMNDVPFGFTVYKGHDFMYDHVHTETNTQGGRVVFVDTGAGKMEGRGYLSGVIVEA